MSTDYTKRLKLWRLTLSVSLPIWMKSVSEWVFHPIRTYHRKLQERQREAELAKQLELEKHWSNLFSNALSQKKPEFELDPKGRVVGLKETASEASIPSVGVWGGGMDQGAVDRALRSTGMKVNFDPADEVTVERRRERIMDEEMMQYAWYRDKKGKIHTEDED